MNEHPQAPSDPIERLHATTDASVWAEEFAKVCPEADEGLMIGWFANAIETAKRVTLDEHPERHMPDDQDFVVLPRSPLLQFLGLVALPPYGPNGDIGTYLDCAPIASEISDWIDHHDLSDLYLGMVSSGSPEADR